MSELCQNLCFRQSMNWDLSVGPDLVEAQWQACLRTCESNLTIAVYLGGFLIAIGVVIYIAVRLAIKHSTDTGA